MSDLDYVYSERFPWTTPHGQDYDAGLWVAALAGDGTTARILVSARTSSGDTTTWLDVNCARALRDHLTAMLDTVDDAEPSARSQVATGNLVHACTRKDSAHRGQSYTGQVDVVADTWIEIVCHEGMPNVVIHDCELDGLGIGNDCLHGGYHAHGTCPETHGLVSA